MSKIKLYLNEDYPIEKHKVRVVQKLNLIPIEERLKTIQKAGNNTFLLKNEDTFLDMLTDSGVNAMSDNAVAQMMNADDAYAGSRSFYRVEQTLNEIFGTKYFLPAHQGRACENVLAKTYVKKGDITLMNYHFTTTKALITEYGGSVVELFLPVALELESNEPFKGNIDLVRLEEYLQTHSNIAFVRLESGTNLIGGQPHSLDNLLSAYEISKKYNTLFIYDASLLMDNLYFIKTREAKYKDLSIPEIAKIVASNCDILYFSARKLGFARGGAIVTNSKEHYEKMRPLIPLFEGFLTYGGMSVREMEAIAVGLKETMDLDVISQGPEFINYMVNELVKRGVPVVTPAGGLGCHLNAMKFLDHIPQSEYPAGALASAFYLVSGCRGMERGTLSEQRDEFGVEHPSNMELLRLALPRRVFTLSQIKYAIDRICWLYDNRKLVGGLKWVEEPGTLRFFFGRLEELGSWQEALVKKYIKDFPNHL
jgi:tryptophanase